MTEAKVIRPIDPEWPEVKQLELIGTALGRGMPWAAVAKVLGLPSKSAAKRHRKALEHRIRVRQMVPPEVPHDGPSTHVHTLPATEEEMAAAPLEPSFTVTREES